MYICIYIYTYIHTYIHINIGAHTHAHTCIREPGRAKGYTSSITKTFEENRITGYALLRLSNSDMAEMMVPIGVRKNLLADIQLLRLNQGPT
jgi:hypothetical protein